MTAFKKISEYIIAGILLASIAGLAAKRREFDPGVFRLLIASIAVTIASEIAFTLYSDAYGFFNMVGHYLKIVSFFLIYRAVVVTGLERPYAIVFRRLKQSEESLRKERDFTAAVLSTEGALVMVLDREGRIVRFNRACERLTKYSFAEVKGKRFWDFLLDEEQIDSAKAIFQDLPSAHFRHEHENFWIGKDGSRRLVMWFSTPLLDDAGQVEYIVGTGIDITARKKAEEALQRSRDELELRVKERTAELRRLLGELAHVTRLTTLGEFTASLAHELNQPLTAIVSNAHASLRLLLRDNPDLGEVREALQDVADDGVRAGEVIRRLRALAKRGVSAKTRFDLNQAIREIVDLARSEAASKGSSIQLALGDGLPEVLGDRVQVQQVVMNLLLNGMEAMADTHPESRELLVTTERTDAGEIEVAVRDAGTGIEPEKLEEILEPFVTTKSEGMGMGLSINRSILQAHGGRLWATNNPERGATFHFTLPVDREDVK